MPTSEEVQAFQAVRAKFLSALWDAESQPSSYHPGGPRVGVQTILGALGLQHMPATDVGRLITSLIRDRLIDGESMTYDDLYPPTVCLTTSGNREVEHWVISDRPTPNLPVTYTWVQNMVVINGHASGVILNQGTKGSESKIVGT